MAMKFRLLRGNHRLGAVRDEHGRVLKPGKNVKPGEIIETTVDLCKTFPSQPPKFERINEIQEEEFDFETLLRKMTKNQLIEKAEAEEFDIEGCNTKEEIVTAMLAQVEDE